MSSIIVIDDFYSDPYYVREQAFKMKWYDELGNHPGTRTKPNRHPTVKTLLEKKIGQEITVWDVDWEHDYNGSFNLCKSWDKCWIHSDWGTNWACVVYLTPDAPVESGTALYRHKKTGYRVRPDDEELAKKIDQDSLDFTAWEMTDYVGNIFNRAVVYRGEYYHAAVQYFGTTDEYCRMHQTFFFSTE